MFTNFDESFIYTTKTKNYWSRVRTDGKYKRGKD